MTSPTLLRQISLLLGATMMIVASCGGSGLSTKGSGNDASLTTGGSGGQSSHATETSSSGGSRNSTSSNQGGTISSAISSSAGKPSSSGGIFFASSSRNGGTISSSESSSDVGGKIVSPREPILHRPQATSCEGVFAPPEPVEPGSACNKHADCTAGKNGRCWASGVGWYGVRLNCYYDTCATDADCDPGKVCYCSPNTPAQCFYSGNCLTDADCGEGTIGYCSPASGSDCRGYHPYSAYYCHTPKDTCIEDRDCTGQDYCDYNVVNGRWECTKPNLGCVMG